MTQIHSAAGWGQRGSGWQCLEKAWAGGTEWETDANVSAFWRKGTHHPELAHLTEARGLESLCWALLSNHLVVQVREAQEGRDLPRVLQLVGGRAKNQTWEVRHLSFSPSSAPPQEVTAPLWERGDKELGGCEDPDTSRTQGSGCSKYLIHGHYRQGFTFCVLRHRRRTGEVVSPCHWGPALSVSRAPPSSRPLPPSSPLCQVQCICQRPLNVTPGGRPDAALRAHLATVPGKAAGPPPSLPEGSYLCQPQTAADQSGPSKTTLVGGAGSGSSQPPELYN